MGPIDRDYLDDEVEAAGRIKELEAALSTAEPDRKALMEALEPFAMGGPAELLAEDISVMRERIVDWFGPSDFRKAREVLLRLRSEAEGKGTP